MVNIISLNANGLRSITKMENILSLIKDWNIDFLLLQETHWDDEFVSDIRKICNQQIFYCNYTNTSCGVAILANNRYKDDIKLTHKDDQGRFVSITLNINDMDITIANVYAPNACSEKVKFFKNINAYLKNDKIILAGDFNTSLSVLDRYNTIHKKDQAFYEINRIMEMNNLCDIWRKRFPTTRAYSWKRIIENNLKMSRLDYFLLSDGLRNFVSQITHKDTFLSDHSFVLLRLRFGKQQRGPGVWVLNNSILQEDDYINKISELLNREKTCTLYNDEITVWWDNFKYKVKQQSQLYSKQRVDEQNKKYNILQKKIQELPNNGTIDHIKYENLKKSLSIIELEKCNGAILRSKAQWAIKGDKNTKYFLNLEKYRQNKNVIGELFLENGDLVTDTDGILECEFEFYRKLYSCVEVKEENIENYLTNIEKPEDMDIFSICEQPIDTEEIYKALSKMKRNKTPGPDGLTVEFYLTFWNQLKYDILRLFKSIYDENCMTRTMRHGHITLIYKKGDKRRLKNYRPISLLNVDYKILARVMSNRLRTVIPKIISPTQTSCVLGKDISDTIASVRDVISMVENNNTEGYILKLDQEKAFDRVSHAYLFRTLEKLGFGPNFCKWIKIFYTEIYSAVKCNGHLSKYFPLHNSVRQGCPISALLYVLTAEPLARSIAARNNIKGIDIPNTNIESVLFQHADDTTFTLANKSSIENVFDEFDNYSLASGSKININKSEVLCIGSGDITGNDSSKFGIKECENVIQVLGVFLGKNQKICDDLNWTDKTTNIKKTLNMWKQRHLTIQGRATVISALLLSKLWYTLMVEPMPECVLKCIKTDMLQYLWMKKSYPVHCNTMIAKKTEGGLYIPDIEMKAKSFRLKFLKRFVDDKYIAIWKHTLSYFLNSEFKMNLCYEYLFLTLPSKQLLKLPKVYYEMFNAWNHIRDDIEFDLTPSNILQQPLFYNSKIMFDNKLIYFKFLLEAGIVRIKDLLYEVIPGFLRVSAIKEMVIDKNEDISEVSVEKALMIIKNSIPFHWMQIIEKPNKNKDSEKVDFILNVNGKYYPFLMCRTNMLYQLLISKIVQLPISSLYWKQLYKQFDNKKCSKIIHLPPKLPDMIDLDFRIFHNIIYTNKILQKIGYIETAMCNFCKNKVEDIVHLFFKCKRLEKFVAFVLRNVETLLKNVPNECINTLNCEQMFILGYCDKYKNINFVFVNIYLSMARLCILRTRNYFIQTGKEIDVIHYFKSTLQKTLTIILKFHTMEKSIHEFDNTMLKNNSLVKRKNDVLQIEW